MGKPQTFLCARRAFQPMPHNKDKRPTPGGGVGRQCAFALGAKREAGAQMTSSARRGETSGFEVMPSGRYVAKRGCSEDNTLAYVGLHS